MKTTLRISCIYGLVDPGTKLVRYIGATRELHSRLTGHANPRTWDSHSVAYCQWRVELARMNSIPGVVILELCKEEVRFEREQEWIKKGFAEGWPLTNMPQGTTAPTEATKQKKKLMKAFFREVKEYRVWVLE